MAVYIYIGTSHLTDRRCQIFYMPLQIYLIIKVCLIKRNVHDKCNSLPCPQLCTSVDYTITRSIPEIESTNDKMHTQAECITSLFPRLNNRR